MYISRYYYSWQSRDENITYYSWQPTGPKTVPKSFITFLKLHVTLLLTTFCWIEYTTLEIHNLCFFVELFLTQMRYWEVELANRVVKSDSMHVCTPEAWKVTWFSSVSSELYLALENRLFSLFFAHISCVFSMNYSWQLIWAVKEALY